MLLEREALSRQLDEALERARRGRGVCVQVHGEAGAGKTSLLRAFAAALPSGTACLWAGCEPLLTPRPLSPFVDLADHWPPSLAAALRDGQRRPGLLADLRSALGSAFSVLVVEDLHWADAATLEAVRYIGRRLAGLPLLLVLSYRDDDGAACRPLRALLGELPAVDCVRIEVPALTPAAVRALAQAAGRPYEGLFEATGGNAFFVTETLGGPAGAPSASVRDAVLARLEQLSPAARAAAEQVAVSPAPLAARLLECLVDDPGLLEECCDKGLLRAQAGGLSFRHELARLAVLQALSPLRAARLHRRLFDALSAEDGVAPERLVHHAAQAGLDAEVLALAPPAARAAAAVSAHREAAALYRLAVQRAAALAEAPRAALLEAAAVELRLVGASDEAVAAAEQALALHRRLDDGIAIGRSLRCLALDHHARGRATSALALVDEAISTLRPLAGDAARAELARACGERSRLLSGLSLHAPALAAGSEALALAEALQPAPEWRGTLVHALRCAALARLAVRDEAAAFDDLERALGLASTLDDDDLVAQLYGVLQMTSLMHRRHAQALAYADCGQVWCVERDLDVQRAALLDNRALSLVETGRWGEAHEALAECLALPGCRGRLHHSVLFLQARLRLREGDDGVAAYWRHLGAAPRGTPLGYRLPAVHAACAEAAWLLGDVAAALHHARQGAETAVAARDPRLLGPVLVWLARLGAPPPAHALAIAPEHAHELSGDHAAAAAVWQAHGCPYEAALAGLHGGEADIRRALDTLMSLKAAPAAAIARSRLRALGSRSVPAGPLRSTRQDPAGLTLKERQVHVLLAQGLSNVGIAARLHRSPRTVEKHVAQVLVKLGVSSRRAVAERAPVG